MPNYKFIILDVFTDRPLAGNPLAVFPDADALDEGTMQAIAREFNFSETTFVVTPRAAGAARRLRCFSPTAEVFGAGHNALGAWWAILARGDVVPEGDVVRQELGDRVLPVEITQEDGALRRLAMTQLRPSLTPVEADRSRLPSALGLAPDALHPTLDPCVASTGATTHLLVPLRGLDDLRRTRVDARELVAFAKPLGCEGCYVFCLETLEPASAAHARGFFPGIGIAEDPATGSAAGPLGAYLVQRNLAPAGEWFTIEQGDALQRPSRIQVRVTGDGVDVGGSCAIVAVGQLSI